MSAAYWVCSFCILGLWITIWLYFAARILGSCLKQSWCNMLSSPGNPLHLHRVSILANRATSCTPCLHNEVAKCTPAKERNVMMDLTFPVLPEMIYQKLFCFWVFHSWNFVVKSETIWILRWYAKLPIIHVFPVSMGLFLFIWASPILDSHRTPNYMISIICINHLRVELFECTIYMTLRRCRWLQRLLLPHVVAYDIADELVPKILQHRQP